MTFKLPNYVLYCLDLLEDHGFEAWCVGGAVRDHIMGKQPFDYDITTNASPKDIIGIFPKTVPTGIQHGTVTVVTSGGNVEITTYRSDGEYSDHRTPDNVTFVNSIDADLSRRDFTMNAICYNPKVGFYDPENGIADINNRTIRSIGDPDRRFTEDALRIMRAFRFSAQLGFNIEETTKSCAISLSDLLRNISVERVYAELKRALTSKFALKTEPLFTCGALSHLGLSCYRMPENFEALPFDFAFRIAFLCKYLNTEPLTVLSKLKSDNNTKHKADIYSALLEHSLPQNKPDIKRMLSIGERSAVETVISYYEKTGIDTAKTKEMLREVFENNEPYRVDMLDISGDDLIELNYKGKEIGNILEQLLQYVIQHPDANTKDKLMLKLK